MSLYLNEPVVLVLRDQLSEALLTAQAMTDNAIAANEDLPPVVAFELHNQLIELERCIYRSIQPHHDNPA